LAKEKRGGEIQKRKKIKGTMRQGGRGDKLKGIANLRTPTGESVLQKKKVLKTGKEGEGLFKKLPKGTTSPSKSCTT